MIENNSFYNTFISPSVYKIISLIDKNPLSQTYGCFDRAFHHYKSKSFPNSMMQCYGMILAKIYSYQSDNNPFFHDKQIKRLLLASIRYTIACSRKDGSCDEHYLGEDSHVARVFSLIALLYILLEFPDIRLRNQEVKRLERMIQWPDGHPETDTIANHIAATLLMYLLASKYFKRDYSLIVKKWVRNLSNAQHEDGWFSEYDGCDLGYQTLTNLFLFESVCVLNEIAFVDKDSIKNELEHIYSKSVGFISEFITPDGTLPAGFGSRNTAHLFITGFIPFVGSDKKIELVMQKFAQNYTNGNIERIEDDMFLFFPLMDISLAITNKMNDATIQKLSIQYSDFKKNLIEKRTKGYIKDIQLREFPQSGFYLMFNSNFSAYISTKPLMSIEIFNRDELEYRSMGNSFFIKTTKGKILKGTTCEVYSIEFSTNESAIVMRGSIREEKKEILNSIKHLALLFFGIFANISFMKKILKKLLIKRVVNKKKREIGNFNYKIYIISTKPDIAPQKNLTTIKVENSFSFFIKPQIVISYKEFIKSEKYVPSNGFYCQKKFLAELSEKTG